MSHTPHVCDSCAKICEEAKSNVKKLQKKVYVLTIACTSAFTLLGEQGVKTVMGTVNSINSIVAPKDQKEVDNKKEVEKTAFVPRFNRFLKSNQKQQIKTNTEQPEFFEPKEKENENKDEMVASNLPKNLIKTITQDSIPTELSMQPNANTLSPLYPKDLFLTPSTLPFDVYSTTLALGDDYGFGGYYGMNTGYVDQTAIPDAKAISILTFGTLLNSRKRTI